MTAWGGAGMTGWIQRIGKRSYQPRARLFRLLILLVLMAPASAGAAPKADLWQRWAAFDPASTLTIDHRPFDQFLKRVVLKSADGINRVAWRFVLGDGKSLDAYLAAMKAVPISRATRAQQFAYWVNLYTALTLKLVAERYPVATIRDIDISPGYFADGPWGRKLIRVEGVAVSLDDIEHRILRPIWKDARIHYVVNCAAIGCPNLGRDAFTAANTEGLLERAARDYVNHPRGVRFESARLIVSSLYDWYQEDFGGSAAGVISHLKRYAEAPLLARLDRATAIDGNAYDWALTDAKAGPISKVGCCPSPR